MIDASFDPNTSLDHGGACSMSNLEDTKVQHRWTDVRSDLAELLPEN